MRSQHFRFRCNSNLIWITIQSIVNIPCSLILDNGDRIITVDHREPKLKVLKDFYEVYFKFDKTVHDRKYDIRKYAKMLA